MSAPPVDTFTRSMERIETLIDALEQQPQSQTLEQARELLHAVLEVHGIGLHAIWEQLRAEAGTGLARQLTRDARIAPLLALHGLQDDVASVADHAQRELIDPASLVRGGGARS